MSELSDKLTEYREKFELVPHVVCNDGFTMSVQASKSHYCTPRIDNASEYTHVEVGFSSEHVEEFEEYLDGDRQMTDNVCGWVPLETVENVIDQHGGFSHFGDN